MSGLKKCNILIDDDVLVHMTWRLSAQAAGHELVVFSSVQDFLKVESQFDRSSSIFIDGNLGPGLRGEIESKKLRDLGFHNIVLETGDDHKTIQKPDWIQRVQGKTPPW